MQKNWCKMFDFLKEIDCQKLLAVKKKFDGGERQIVMGLNSFAAGFFIGTMGRGGAVVAKDADLICDRPIGQARITGVTEK